MRFSEQMNIELTYDMQGMNNETKTYQTFTLPAETKRLPNATTLRYTFHTHFNSTQHDAVVLYAVAKQMKDEMPPRAYYALWYAPPSGHATIKKTIIDQRIAARQTCCYSYFVTD